MQKSKRDSLGRDSAIQNFREAKNLCRKTIRDAKQKSWEDFLDGLSSETSNSELWRRVNALNGKRRTRGITLEINNSSVDEAHIVANEIAKYFHSLSATENYTPEFQQTKSRTEASHIEFQINQTVNDEEYNQVFSMEELLRALDGAHGKSSGPDNIGYPMLKRLPYCAKKNSAANDKQPLEDGKFPQ